MVHRLSSNFVCSFILQKMSKVKKIGFKNVENEILKGKQEIKKYMRTAIFCMTLEYKTWWDI